jgi:DNA polymerase delta subunit 1
VRQPQQKKSYCQLEVDVHTDALLAHEPVGEWMKIAPMRILSFDIECAGRKGHFPTADIDPVIQIGNVLAINGQKQPIARNVFTLKSCAAIVGAQVLSFENEYEMLSKWKEFMLIVRRTQQRQPVRRPA